jgi:hypothetical protein
MERSLPRGRGTRPLRRSLGSRVTPYPRPMNGIFVAMTVMN